MPSITLTLEEYPQLEGEIYAKYLDQELVFKDDPTTRDLLTIGVRPEIYTKYAQYATAQMIPYKIIETEKMIAELEEAGEDADMLKLRLQSMKDFDCDIPLPTPTAKETEAMLRFNVKLLNQLYQGDLIKDWMDVEGEVLSAILLHEKMSVLTNLLYG